MNNINLEIKYIEFIKNTVFSVVEDAEIFIFGSRVQGNSQKYSDVDIAINTKEKIDINKILRLKSLFNDSVFPYKVDIIDLNSIDENFFNIIKDDLVKIN
ncbi:MAG: nucleotidyltransferase domain-containing protein [Cyanobacteria bacterium SIG28]|nr:nucleotidyltransferase domain-containing protein [Cyanobacteria bacterium SIG28]